MGRERGAGRERGWSEATEGGRESGERERSREREGWSEATEGGRESGEREEQ